MTIINHILQAILIWLLLWNAYILIWNKGIPNIRTAPAIRKRIIALLQEDMRGKAGQPYVVIDLGSGNGLFTRQIARAMPGAQVVGIEISKLAHRWALRFRRWSGLPNLTCVNSDFNDYNLGQADAVVMFLHVYFMQTIGEKLHRELKPGALATSNKFPLGDGWTPRQAVDVRTLYPHQKTFYLYRKDVL